MAESRSMTLPVLVALLIVALLVAGPLSKNVRAVVHEANCTKTQLRFVHLQRITGWCGFVLFILAYIFSVLNSPELTLASLMLTVLMWGLSGYIALAAKIAPDASGTSLRNVFFEPIRHYWNKASAYLSGLWKVLAPEGWKEVNLKVDILSLDRKFNRFYLGITAIVFASFPLFLASAAILFFGSDSHIAGPVMRTYGNYFLLLSASCLTLALLTTMASMALLRTVGLITWKPSYRRAVTTIAGWAGAGVIFGAAVAALTPLVSGVWPYPPVANFSLESALTPQLLLNLSAAGAAIGYTLGLLASLYALSSSATNLVYRTVSAPLIFTVWTLGFSGFANPSAILMRIVESIRDETTPVSSNMSQTEAEELLSSDWSTLLVFIYDNGFPFPAATSWWRIVTVTLTITTIFMLVRSAIKRYNRAIAPHTEMHEEDQTSEVG